MVFFSIFLGTVIHVAARGLNLVLLVTKWNRREVIRKEKGFIDACDAIMPLSAQKV